MRWLGPAGSVVILCATGCNGCNLGPLFDQGVLVDAGPAVAANDAGGMTPDAAGTHGDAGGMSPDANAMTGDAGGITPDASPMVGDGGGMASDAGTTPADAGTGNPELAGYYTAVGDTLVIGSLDLPTGTTALQIAGQPQFGTATVNGLTLEYVAGQVARADAFQVHAVNAALALLQAYTVQVDINGLLATNPSWTNLGPVGDPVGGPANSVSLVMHSAGTYQMGRTNRDETLMVHGLQGMPAQAFYQVASTAPASMAAAQPLGMPDMAGLDGLTAKRLSSHMKEAGRNVLKPRPNRHIQNFDLTRADRNGRGGRFVFGPDEALDDLVVFYGDAPVWTEPTDPDTDPLPQKSSRC